MIRRKRSGIVDMVAYYEGHSYNECRNKHKSSNFARCNECKERFLCWTECKPNIDDLLQMLDELAKVAVSYQLTIKEFAEIFDGFNKENSEKV